MYGGHQLSVPPDESNSPHPPPPGGSGGSKGGKGKTDAKGTTDKTPRQTACTGCHAAKVKCDKCYPCARCIRLGLADDCVPHVSQQGKGKGRKRKLLLSHAEAVSSSSTLLSGRGDGKKKSGDGGAVSVDSGHVAGGRRKRSGSGTSPSKRRSAAGTDAAAAATASAASSRMATGEDAASGRGQNSQQHRPGLEESMFVSATTLGPGHFGLRHLLRTWVAFAIKRRSFSLLAKASTLAAKTGVTMDNILCGIDDAHPEAASASAYSSAAPFGLTSTTAALAAAVRAGLTSQPSAALAILTAGGNDPSLLPALSSSPPMTFLLPALLTSSSRQVLDNTPLSWTELPPDLLKATGCQVALTQAPDDGSGRGGQLSPVLGSRWIFIRSLHNGTSRYFVSSAFERDIVSWATIQSTWNANSRDVISLFLPKSEMAAHTRGLMHQFSIHPKPGMPLRASRYRTKIKVWSGVAGAQHPEGARANADGTVEVAVDGVMCQKMVDLDTAFVFIEYVRDEVSPASVLASLSNGRGIGGLMGGMGAGSTSSGTMNGDASSHHDNILAQSMLANSIAGSNMATVPASMNPGYSRVNSSGISAVSGVSVGSDDNNHAANDRNVTGSITPTFSSADAPGGAGSGIDGLDFFDLDTSHASLDDMNELLGLIRQCP